MHSIHKHKPLPTIALGVPKVQALLGRGNIGKGTTPCPSIADPGSGIILLRPR